MNAAVRLHYINHVHIMTLTLDQISSVDNPDNPVNRKKLRLISCSAKFICLTEIMATIIMSFRVSLGKISYKIINLLYNRLTFEIRPSRVVIRTIAEYLHQLFSS